MSALDLIEKAVGFEYLPNDQLKEISNKSIHEKEFMVEDLLIQPVANAITNL